MFEIFFIFYRFLSTELDFNCFLTTNKEDRLIKLNMKCSDRNVVIYRE